MRQRAGKLVIAACVGIAIGWFGHGMLGDVPEQRVPADQTHSNVNAGVPDAGPSQTAAPRSPETRAKAEGQNKSAAGSAAPTQSANSAGHAVIAGSNTGDASSDSVASATKSAGSTDSTQPKAATPAESLLSASSVKCDFSQGNSGTWQNQALTVGTAAWQGGPLMYDSINLAAETARMTGNAILTGSVTEGANVTAAATNSALHLYGVASNGTLTSTTLFGAARNAAGHYTAVMSYHGPNLHNDQESAQFYGTCDITG